jgi:hypothetical protein
VLTLLLALALALAAGPACADPIITPALIAAGVTGTILGVSTAAILSQVIVIAIGLGISMLSSVLFKPPQPKPSDGQVIYKQPAGTRTRSYGRVKVGGLLVYANSAGGVLDRVIAMGSGEIDAVEQHWIDDNLVTLSGNAVSSPSQYLGKCLIEFRLGTDSPAPYSGLVTAWPALWTNDHLGKGIPSAWMEMFQVPSDHMSDVWPQYGSTLYRQVQRAAKVPDISGGALTAPTWSDNAARVILDYLTHPDGLKLDPSWITNAAADWTTAIAVCNEDVGGEPRYRIWNTYRFDERPADILARYLQACDAAIFPTPDQGLSIKVGKWSAPTVTIDGDAIIGFAEFGRGRDVLSTANTIRARYTSPDHDYLETDADPWVDDADVAARGEYAIDLDFFSSPSHSQTRRLMKLAAARANPVWVGKLDCNLRALPAMGERYVNVIIPELAISQTFEILGIQMVIVDGSVLRGISIQIASLDASAYDWVTTRTADTGTPPAIPGAIVPSRTIPVPTGLAVTPLGTIARVTWDAPPDDFLNVDVQYKATAGTEWLAAPVVLGSTIAGTGPLVDGVEYEIQVRHRSTTTSRVSEWTASELLTLVADPTAPGVVTGLVATPNDAAVTVALSWVLPNSANCVGARVYRNTTNSFAGATLRTTVFGAPNTAQAYTDTATGLGLVYYWVVAVNASGVESSEVASGGIAFELLQNTDFATDTIWTKGTGWSIAAGKASKTAGTAAQCAQSVSLVAGKSYVVRLTVLDFAAGGINIRLAGGTTVPGAVRVANGTYSETLVAAVGNVSFQINGNATFAGSADSVSCKELVP